MEDIVIIGLGGHGKSVADSIYRTQKYNIVGYTDFQDMNCQYKYLGKDEALKDLFEQGVHNAVLGVGYLGKTNVRDSIVFHAKKLGYEFPSIIDPSAEISQDVIIDDGVYIGKRVVVNTGVKIGSYCIINTGAIIEHECRIEDYSHISVGAILCGEVSVGHHSMVGAGATVIHRKIIGNSCIIGANSTVVSDVGDNMVVYGIVNKKSGGYRIDSEITLPMNKYVLSEVA